MRGLLALAASLSIFAAACGSDAVRESAASQGASGVTDSAATSDTDASSDSGTASSTTDVSTDGPTTTANPASAAPPASSTTTAADPNSTTTVAGQTPAPASTTTTTAATPAGATPVVPATPIIDPSDPEQIAIAEDLLELLAPDPSQVPEGPITGTAEPTTGLQPGDVVTLTLGNLAPGAFFAVAQCAAEAADAIDLSNIIVACPEFTFGTSDNDGNATVTVTVVETVGTTNCRVDQCLVGIATVLGDRFFEPISFG